MFVFLSGVGLFFAAFLVQIIVWRIRVPKKQLHSLVSVVASVFVIGTMIIVLTKLSNMTGPISILGYMLIMMLYGGLSATYIIFFTAVEADSPSLTMINLLSGRGAEGISLAEAKAKYVENSFVESRIEQMLQDGLAIEKDGRLHVGFSGGLLYSMVLYYRRLLGLGASGG